MHYFAYGSNMSLRRLRRRVPSAQAIGAALLHGHRLAFHKAGRDGSAKCDALQLTDPAARVHGVIFRIAELHKAGLDRHEGLGNGYEQKWVQVTRPDGATLQAMTYFATAIDARLRPFSWYLEHVVRGALEHGLPDDYIAQIVATEVQQDADRQRHVDELSIYA